MKYENSGTRRHGRRDRERRWAHAGLDGCAAPPAVAHRRRWIAPTSQPREPLISSPIANLSWRSATCLRGFPDIAGRAGILVLTGAYHFFL